MVAIREHTWFGLRVKPVVRLAAGMSEMTVLLCSRLRSALVTLPSLRSSAWGGCEASSSPRCSVTLRLPLSPGIHDTMSVLSSVAAAGADSAFTSVLPSAQKTHCETKEKRGKGPF